MVFGHLGRRLLVWSLVRGAVIADDVRLNGLQTFDKVGHIHHQIALDREVGQRLNLDTFGVIPQEGFTGQLRHLIDHHAAGAADRHPAGPAVAQVGRQVVFNVAQRVQQRGLLIVRHVIERAVRCRVDLRVVTHHFDFQVFHLSHGWSPSSQPLPPQRHKHVSPAAAW